MKVLRRPGQPPANTSNAGGSKSAAAAAGAKPGTPTVSGTNSSSSRPGIKIVSRAAPPPKPQYTGPSPAEVESRKVAELLLRLALDVADANPDVTADENINIFEVCDGANDIDAVVGVAGFSFLQSSGVLQALAKELEDLDNAEGREAALLAFKQLSQSVGRACEPYLVPLLPVLLDRKADKVAAVREAAGLAAQALAEAMCPRAVELALPSKCVQWLGVAVALAFRVPAEVIP